MEKGGGYLSSSKAICSKEALEVLNCVTESQFDHQKCLTLIHSLRHCVLTKKVKKFTLAEESEEIDHSKSKKES